MNKVHSGKEMLKSTELRKKHLKSLTRIQFINLPTGNAQAVVTIMLQTTFILIEGSMKSSLL